MCDPSKAGDLGEIYLLAELTRRGFHAASFLGQAPADIVSMWNDRLIKKIQVKSKVKDNGPNAKARKLHEVRFNIRRSVSGKAAKYEKGTVDFFCLVPLFTQERMFYVIPFDVVTGDTVIIRPGKKDECSYREYINAFDLLKK